MCLHITFKLEDPQVEHLLTYSHTNLIYLLHLLRKDSLERNLLRKFLSNVENYSMHEHEIIFLQFNFDKFQQQSFTS